MRKVSRMLPVKEWNALDVKSVRFIFKALLFPVYLAEIVFNTLLEWAEAYTNKIDEYAEEAAWMYLELKRRFKKVKK